MTSHIIKEFTWWNGRKVWTFHSLTLDWRYSWVLCSCLRLVQTHSYRIVKVTTIPSTKCLKLFLPWFSTLHLELWGTGQSCHRKNPLRWDSREKGLQTESSSWLKTWMLHMGTTPGSVILGMLTWEFHCIIVLKLEC